jgi:hypothetical protein
MFFTLRGRLNWLRHVSSELTDPSSNLGPATEFEFKKARRKPCFFEAQIHFADCTAVQPRRVSSNDKHEYSPAVLF